MRINKKKIGLVIRERREVLGLLQQQLAVVSGVGIRTIQMVERGQANPSLDTLMQIADPLGLTVQLVLKDLNQEEQV